MNRTSKENGYEAYISDKLWMRFNPAEEDENADGDVCCLHIEVENDAQQEAYEMIRHLLYHRCGCCFDGAEDTLLCEVQNLAEYRSIRREFKHILNYRKYAKLWED